MRRNKKIKLAFTLAEVLITIAVVGVVASMTMPVLINNINNKTLNTQVDKSKNILTNSIKLMLSKEGSDYTVASLPFMKDCSYLSNLSCLSANWQRALNIISDTSGDLNVNTLPLIYTTDEGEESPFKWADMNYVFVTSDGITYGLIPNDSYTSIDVVVDANNKQKPNVVKKDLHKYRVANYGGNIVDVSDELLPNEKSCDIDNLENCKTQADCEAVDFASFASKHAGLNSYLGWSEKNGCIACVHTDCLYPDGSSEGVVVLNFGVYYPEK